MQLYFKNNVAHKASKPHFQYISFSHPHNPSTEAVYYCICK